MKPTFSNALWLVNRHVCFRYEYVAICLPIYYMRSISVWPGLTSATNKLMDCLSCNAIRGHITILLLLSPPFCRKGKATGAVSRELISFLKHRSLQIACCT